MQNKIIILIRHGQTNSNDGEQRGLTKRGIARIKKNVTKMRKFISENSLILTTDKQRTIQTAQIIADKLSSSFEIFDNRIKGIDNIANLIQQNEINNINMANTYLSLKNYSELGIETPAELFKRWNEEILKYNHHTIIIVSHEGSLEAYLQEYQNKPLFKSFKQYFNYTDFAILKFDS